MIRLTSRPAEALPDDEGAWENEGGHLPSAASLEDLGIARTYAESYSVGAYRYTNLADAVAQANRERNCGGQRRGKSA